MRTTGLIKNMLLLVASLAIRLVQADTYYVDVNNGSPSAPYESWGTAANDIQSAVNAAVAGDTVLVNKGTYVLSSEILVSVAITIESVNGPGSTIVDGNNSVRCFNLGSSACTIRGLTIQNGSSGGNGGGILCSSTIPLLTNCLITENSAFNGGGMFNGEANNCTITGNSAVWGGGTYWALVKNSIVWNNTATSGNNIFAGTTSYSCSPDVAHGVNGNINNDPKFVNQTGGDYHLLLGSPCIDAGANGLVVGTVDLDGQSRIFNGTVDMGAFEFHPLPVQKYVSLSGLHQYPFASWVTAATNIQSVLDISQDGRTVIVSNGTYLLSSEIMVSSDVMIQSVNGTENTIIDGAGVSRCFNLGDTSCTVSGFTIQGGYTAENGGGVYCTSELPVVTNCIVRDNEADNGGGIFKGTVEHCVVRNNVAAGDGGGMYMGSARNCLVVDNRARDNGGGLYESSSVNCTITENIALTLGYGIFGGFATNSIIWFNDPTINETNEIHNTSCSYSCSPQLTAGVSGNINGLPRFLDRNNGNYRLTMNSPCIDAGNTNAATGSIDLGGNARIFNTIVDMGAYEYGSGSGDADSDGIPDEWEMQYFSTTTNGPTFNGDMDFNNNLAEYIAGTDPTNAASYFHVEGALYTTGGFFVVTWEPAADRVYTVQWMNSLTNAPQFLQSVKYPQNSYTDTVHSADDKGFYNLKVELQ